MDTVEQKNVISTTKFNLEQGHQIARNYRKSANHIGEYLYKNRNSPKNIYFDHVKIMERKLINYSMDMNLEFDCFEIKDSKYGRLNRLDAAVSRTEMEIASMCKETDMHYKGDNDMHLCAAASLLACLGAALETYNPNAIKSAIVELEEY
jgi:hypothetical protein